MLVASQLLVEGLKMTVAVTVKFGVLASSQQAETNLDEKDEPRSQDLFISKWIKNFDALLNHLSPYFNNSVLPRDLAGLSALNNSHAKRQFMIELACLNRMDSSAPGFLGTLQTMACLEDCAS